MRKLIRARFERGHVDKGSWLLVVHVGPGAGLTRNGNRAPYIRH